MDYNNKIFLSIAGATLILFTAQMTYAQDDAWVQKALKLQRSMDINAPLKEATFLGTHNSYNSRAYQNATRYVDPNQNLSLYEQLETGIRSIELDAHWTSTKSFSKAILLCHGQNNHLGCSPFDKPIEEGLRELRDWLLENPGEIVLLYIERHLDQHEPRLANRLEDILGEFIYKPKISEEAAKTSCLSLPTDLSKADILKAKKQLIIVTKGCSSPKNYAEKDKFSENFNEYVFAGIGNLKKLPDSFIDSRITSFSDYPKCGKTTTFAADPQHKSLWRIFEDRTSLSGATGHERYLLAKDMSMLYSCNINWPTFDMLSKSDDRLAASVWSWAPSFPKENAGRCAMYVKGSGIQNLACKQIVAGVACQNTLTHEFKVVRGNDVWANSEKVCQTAGGATWHFSSPVNGYEMSLVKNNLPTDLSEVWLNYKLDKQSNWTVSNMN